MNKYARLIAGILLLVAGGVYGFYSYSRFVNAGADDQSTASSGETTPNQPPPKPGEDCWIVDQTLRDIANILIHARGDAKPAQVNVATEPTVKPSVFNIRIDSLPEPSQIELSHYIWGGENYVPLAKNIIQTWKLETPSAPATDDGMAARLTTPEPSLLISEGQRLTKALAQHPLDPELNEQAALLLGTFAMREASGSFSDVRATLCKMTAHLVVAQASRPVAGTNGKLATLVLLSLAGREAEALAGLHSLETSQPAWANALKMRNTGDWRTVPEPLKATLLEQLEWFRAAVDNVDGNFAVDRFPKSLEPNRPDWAHMAVEMGFSVQTGHTFLKNVFALDLNEIATTWRTMSGTPLEEAELVKDLNASPLPELPLKSTTPLLVLGWGDWAAFYQRHVCHDFQATINFARNIWAVPEEDKAVMQQMRAYFSGLTLYPLLEKRCANNAVTCDDGLRKAAILCKDQPWLVTAANWGCMHKPNEFKLSTSAIPYPTRWFQHGMPFETTYDFYSRNWEIDAFVTMEPAGWQLIKDIAPDNYDLLYAWAHNRYGASATPQQMVEALAAVKDYNLFAMREIANASKNSPSAYIEAMQKACALEPNYFNDLGYYLVAQNRPAEAADAYRHAFEHGTDRVWMANDCGWLVDYDYTHDLKDEAERIATEAAEVYSAGGLETMAALREREGRLDEAEQYFDTVRERYNDYGPIYAFYTRHQAEQPAYATQAAAISRSVFGNGMEKASLTDFKAPPVDGVLVAGDSKLLHENGLKPGDVFVAIEGIRVHTVRQYTIVRSLSNDRHFTLVVWSSGAYREVKADAPNRTLNCDIGDYKGH